MGTKRCYLEGKEQGIIDGKKAGLKEGKIILAKKLLIDNIDLNKIIEYTELSKEQILKIKENL